VNYESLLQEAQNQDIFVTIAALPEGTKGIYCNVKDQDIILLSNQIENTTEATLAEELSHYELSSGNITDQSQTVNSKQKTRE
jgi:hypothetical protein